MADTKYSTWYSQITKYLFMLPNIKNERCGEEEQIHLEIIRSL